MTRCFLSNTNRVGVSSTFVHYLWLELPSGSFGYFHSRPTRVKGKVKMNYSNVRRCRLCACEDFGNFINIFDDNPELELEMKISKLLPVVVMPGDPMPHIVCPNCVQKLNFLNDFYELTLIAERFLRTFYPSVPESEIENVDPVVQVMNCNVLKMPPKTRDKSPPASSGPSADSFIVNRITSTDSVFTCRKCFRTFTKRSAAAEHACLRPEDCEEPGGAAATGDHLPPLKIRLFSSANDRFVCYLCQTPFEKKSQMVRHLKAHFARRATPKKKRKEKTRQKRKKQKKRSEAAVPKDGETQKRSEDESKDGSAGKETEPPPPKDEVPVIDLEDDDRRASTISSCVFCDKVFSGTEALIEHQEAHLREYRGKGGIPREKPGTKGYVCRICTMVFARKKTLMDHEKYH